MSLLNNEQQQKTSCSHYGRLEGSTNINHWSVVTTVGLSAAKTLEMLHKHTRMFKYMYFLENSLFNYVFRSEQK